MLTYPNRSCFSSGMSGLAEPPPSLPRPPPLYPSFMRSLKPALSFQSPEKVGERQIALGASPETKTPECFSATTWRISVLVSNRPFPDRTAMIGRTVLTELERICVNRLASAEENKRTNIYYNLSSALINPSTSSQFRKSATIKMQWKFPYLSDLLLQTLLSPFFHLLSYSLL